MSLKIIAWAFFGLLAAGVAGPSLNSSFAMDRSECLNWINQNEHYSTLFSVDDKGQVIPTQFANIKAERDLQVIEVSPSATERKRREALKKTGADRFEIRKDESGAIESIRDGRGKEVGFAKAPNADQCIPARISYPGRKLLVAETRICRELSKTLSAAGSAVQQCQALSSDVRSILNSEISEKGEFQGWAELGSVSAVGQLKPELEPLALAGAIVERCSVEGLEAFASKDSLWKAAVSPTAGRSRSSGTSASGAK